MGGADGWTPLQFYAHVVRNVGIPARFGLRGGEWVADAPFTKPSAATLALLDQTLHAAVRGQEA